MIFVIQVKTVKEIRNNYPKVKVACLYYKETAIETPDIYGKIVGDEWLVFPIGKKR